MPIGLTSACGYAQPNTRQSRCGFTILELLITFGIISVLTGLILPAIGSAREAARQMQCKNQLRQIGLALHTYHEMNNSFPPGLQWELTKKSAYGWAVPLLPYLEQRAIYTKVDRNRVIEHSFNQAARNTSIAFFLCPSDITEPTFTLFEEDDEEEDEDGAVDINVTRVETPLVNLPTANYLGVFGTIEPDDDTPVPVGDGTFCGPKPVSFVHLTRGLSNTFIVGERKMATVPSTWLGVSYSGEDAVCRLVGSAIDSPNCNQCDECEFSSRHPGGTNFLWADGHVRMISASIESNVYQQMARRSKKNVRGVR